MNGQSHPRRIIHVTSAISRSGGGIPPVIWSLARQTQLLGNESLVSGLKDNFFEVDCSSSSFEIVAGKVLGPKALGYSPELRRALEDEVHSQDVVHVHGLWMYPGVLASTLSRRKGCKRVVSPHGMLEPWALKNSPLKKRAAGWCFEKRNLQTADCLHALCVNEAQNIRKYGLNNPIAIIPNGVDLDKVVVPSQDKVEFIRQHPELKDRLVLMFLSRVHPKKGLPDLLRAWAEVKPQKKNWVLLVVGPDELSHEAELRQLAGKLGIDQYVSFAGPAYGEMKRLLLSAADAFVLPSHSEGFSMAVLEAAAAGLPIILTRECNFPELAAAGAAIEVPAGQAGVADGLARLLNFGDPERKQMGAKGLELVKQGYTWPAVARQMMRVYDWLENAGPRPDSVQTV